MADEPDTIQTKTTPLFGSTVKDAAGEPVQERVADDGTVLETIQTKTTPIFGSTVKDAAGEPVKEVIKGNT